MPDAIAQSGELTDARLLADAAAGDRAAFDHVVQRHGASVLRFARSLTRRSDEAEDLLQQTFLSAWQAAAQFRGDGSARGWLLTIARHAAHRQRVRRERERLDDEPVDGLGQHAGWGQSDPEAIVLREEQRRTIAQAFATLTEEDRAILTLRDLEGCSGEETAALLGLGLPAMKSRLHRARLRLIGVLRTGVPHVAR